MLKFYKKNNINTIPGQSLSWVTCRFTTITDTVAGVTNSINGNTSTNGMRYHFTDNYYDQILKLKINTTNTIKFFTFDDITLPSDLNEILINKFIIIPNNKIININYPLFNFGIKRTGGLSIVSIAALVRSSNLNNY